ncbi:MAG: ACT domain-containing protein [Tetrasphaera sp.]
MPIVQTLVLTVSGDDRAGLVSALAEAVSGNGGNWERSQLVELGGKFAGIVLVTVDEASAPALRAALDGLSGLLAIDVDRGEAPEAAGEDGSTERMVRLDLLGNDHPGIVSAISGVLHRHGLNVEELTTVTRDAPMAGGQLFEAHLVARVPEGGDVASVQTDLEQLASEILVDVTVELD